MDHSAYYRPMPDADTAILLIHGVVSTPRHFDWLLPSLPEDAEIHCVLLAGHGGSVEDFSNATMKQWHQQIDETILALEKPGRRIIVIGHSLGSLLALYAAQKYESIRGMILLNIPLAPWVKPPMVSRCLRFPFGKIRVDDPRDMRCYQDLGTVLEPKLWKYVGWTTNMVALLKLARHCRNIPAKLSIPCYAYLDTDDELVSLHSAKWLQHIPNVTLRYLDHYGHFAYKDTDQEIIIQDLNTLLKK